MAKLFVKILDKMFFLAKDLLSWHRKNSYAANFMHLPVSVSNSLQVSMLLAKFFSPLP